MFGRNKAQGPQGPQPKPGQQPQPMQFQFKVIIDYNAMTGQIAVNGPLDNRMLMYGMLKMAELAVNDQYEKAKAGAEKPPVVPVHAAHEMPKVPEGHA